MRTIKLIAAVLLGVMALTFSACNKDEGFTGKGKISGTVTYPSGNAAGAIVYISFGATSATTTFDYSTVADADGKYSFEALNKGDYFVTATYSNLLGYQFTSGGAHVTLNSAKSEATVDLALE